MKTVKDKYLLVAADFAGYPLKEAVVAHLKAKGWKITDVGVQADSDPDTDTDLMFHRIGLRAGALIAEGECARCCSAAPAWGSILPPPNVRTCTRASWRAFPPRCAP